MSWARETRHWRCRDRAIPLDRTRIMGIVNVTPDSFSDGGRWLDPDAAIARGVRLAEEGADLLDIGGESTRPGAAEVSEQEEARRTLPVIRGLAARVSVPLSIDTRRPNVAREAVAAGACVINDIEPFAGNEAMAAVARETGAGLVVMHMRGVPQTMAGLAVYEDVAAEVERVLREALAFAAARGIAADRVVVDPGVGFAKTTRHVLDLLAGLDRLTRLAPTLVGASRKRWIGELCDEPAPDQRLGGSLAAAVWCAWRGVSVIRTHDVKETRQALTVARALAEREMRGTHVERFADRME